MEWNEETETYSTLYRIYSPNTGRWWTTDPIVQPWLSTYNAMDGNPIVLIDPLGSWWRTWQWSQEHRTKQTWTRQQRRQ